MTSPQPLLEDFGRRARELEPDSGDITTILARVHGQAGRRGYRPRRLAWSAALVLLVAGAMAAAPGPRTALGNAIDGFFGAPAPAPDHAVNGRTLKGSQVPAWLRPKRIGRSWWLAPGTRT